jgi:secreted PhoX family phosphatase
VDPVLGHLYLTEDHRETSGFYRFIPEDPRDLRGAGRLQMLRAVGRPRLATHRGRRAGFRPLVPIPVEWVDIPNPDPALELGEPRTFDQGVARGAASFARLEGCWWGGDGCFFNATRGGAARAGQVWQYRSHGADGGELVLVFESPGPHVLDSPDHLCVSPRGGLVLCEDGDDEQYLRGLTRDGTIFDLAATTTATEELAGACFSPDGRVLFFNSLGGATAAAPERGATYALWGSWERGAL